MSKKNQVIDETCTNTNVQKPTKRKSKVFKRRRSSKSSDPEMACAKHHRARSNSSNSSQFERLKTILSNLFPKKLSDSKKSSKPKATRNKRSRSFTFRRKNKNKKTVNDSPLHTIGAHQKSMHKRTASCNISLCSVDWNPKNPPYNTPIIQTCKKQIVKSANKATGNLATNVVLSGIMEEPDEARSPSPQTPDSNDFKCELDEVLPVEQPRLNGPKSSSFMRSFEKRPEYITYYPPASLRDAFSKITVDEVERSVTVETRKGYKQRISKVDELFELASMTLDYANFYGEADDIDHEYIMDIGQHDEYELNDPSVHFDHMSILSSFADDNDNDYDETLSWR